MIPKIAETLVGRKIVKVVCTSVADYGDYEGDGDTLQDVYSPAGDIFLKLDNGMVLCAWNSEWGGIKVLNTKDGYEATQIKFVEEEK